MSRKTVQEKLRYYCNEIEKILHIDDFDTQYEELYNFGLDFSFVEPDTFSNQPLGYYCWLLCCGGPTESFDFYHNGNRVWKIVFTSTQGEDYGYTEIELFDDDFNLLAEIFEIMVPV